MDLKVNVIIIGPQGSGKGTQAKILAKKLEVPHISTGDLIRGTTGEVKKRIDEIINTGSLLPDELTLEILSERIGESDCSGGFILEGYPRNKQQALDLRTITEVDKAFEIFISDEEAVKRLSARSSCRSCGEVFNKVARPEKQKGVCDFCQGELYKRKDDTPDAIKKRLAIYHKDTEPILKMYDTVRINGKQSLEKVSEDIMNALDVII